MENSTQIQFLATFGQDGPVGIIDVDTSVQFPINFAVGDVKEPFAKKGVKSYKFSIVGSKETNQLLNHYYDINIVDGTYNNNRKQKVAILRNGVIILDNAYMQLLNIKKETHDIYSDQQITYDIEVGDDVTSFFTEITNKYLEDLNFSDMTHTYEAANVVASFPFSSIRNNTLGTGGYKYCLPWTPLNKYVLEECRPAISVYEYWNRIHQAAGYQWEWIGYDSDTIRMDRLWIPYNGDEPKLSDQIEYKVAAETSSPFTIGGTGISGFPPTIAPTQFIVDTELIDILGLYDPVLGEYDVNLNTGGGAINFSFQVTFDLIIDNPTAGNIYLGAGFGTGFIPTGYSINWDLTPYIQIFNDSFGTVVNQMNVDTTTLTTDGPFDIYTLPAGQTTVKTGTFIITIPATSVNVANILLTKMGLSSARYNEGGASAVVIFYDDVPGTPGAAPVNVTVDVDVTSVEMIVLPDVKTYGYNIALNMNDFIPRKIKQSDFIKAISNMYNLVITPDATNDRKIIYTLRDDYYDAGTQKDWTNKLATDKGSEISFISNTNSKKVILSYKEDKDIVNKEYQETTKEIYGQQEYELQNENIKGIEQKEIIFSPTPCDDTSFGTVNPMYNGKIPKCNLRILLDGGEQNTGLGGTQTYDIIDYSFLGVDYGELALTTYPMLTHLDNPSTPVFDINFGLCDYYYHNFVSVTNNNLYSMFWRRTIGQIDKGKLFTAYFYLNEYDISILKLNDKIFVKDTWYNINSLQYDPNSFGPTKVVLMTIDDGLALGFPRAILGQPTLATSEAISVLGNNIIQSLNWNYADASVLIRGVGNVVNPDVRNSIVLGDNRELLESNTLYTERIETNVILLNGVDISTNFRTVDTLQTTNATTTAVSIFDIADDTMIIIEGRITGYKSDFTEAIASFYVGTFRKTGGVIVQVGTTNYVTDNDFGVAPVIDLNTDGTNIIFDVKGGAATTINWTNSYEYTLG